MRRRAFTGLVAAAAIAVIGLAVTLGASARGDVLAEIRAATARFHSIEQARAAGYVPFYTCAEEPGVGTMGQHYVNFDLVADPAIDRQHPEALVYEPKQGGGYRLVAIEWVRVGPKEAMPPTVLGVELRYVEAPNRYGIEPGFYQRHLWLYERNPLGAFEDWNPRVSCRGQGDGGG
jgi:hypothetical protein